MFGPILFASTNSGKFVEVSDIASKFGLEILSAAKLLGSASAQKGAPPQVEENGRNYLENAKLKACAWYQWANISTLADDAGLEVIALNGAPGVISARYAGVNATSEENIAKLLSKLKGEAKREATFVCQLYLKVNEKLSLENVGYLKGEIASEPRGQGGFGYDPVFIVPSYGKTLAELKGEGVKVETHRTIALQEMFKKMRF